MKYTLALLAAVAAFGILTPASASARDHCERRIVGYSASGYPVYSVYQIYGYDRWGNPLGRWVTESSCDRGYDRGSYGYSGYRSHGHRSHRPSIPLPPLPHHHRPGAGLSIFFGR
jgi:hypothetical protein